MNWLREFTTGFLIGLANLIPGVSGGTFALVLGVFERLIHFLNNVNIRSISFILRLFGGWITSGCKNDQWHTLTTYLREKDYPFMAVIGFGAVVCIAVMSSVMKYLLLQHFTYTYAYFFGLIVLSVVIPWRMIRSLKPVLLLPAFAGILLTVWITASVNPYDKAIAKSEILHEQYQVQQSSATEKTESESDSKFIYVGKYTSTEYLTIFSCGIIAISAMVLPGISGSLVMILMNQYFAVISAVANIRNLLLDDLLFLSAMALGIGVGLLSFARMIDFALRKFHDPMISFLVGLICGSLYSLWPFKKAEIIPDFYTKEGATIERINDYLVYSNVNIMPADMETGAIATVIVLAGMATMLFFVLQEKK